MIKSIDCLNKDRKVSYKVGDLHIVNAYTYEGEILAYSVLANKSSVCINELTVSGTWKAFDVDIEVLTLVSRFGLEVGTLFSLDTGILDKNGIYYVPGGLYGFCELIRWNGKGKHTINGVPIKELGIEIDENHLKRYKEIEHERKKLIASLSRQMMNK